MTIKPLALILCSAAMLAISLSVRVSTQAPVPPASASAQPAERAYVGSQTCRRCHTATYERWAKTRMANVVVDPRVRPDAVLPDFSKPDPLLTFKLDEVAFVYGIFVNFSELFGF